MLEKQPVHVIKGFKSVIVPSTTARERSFFSIDQAQAWVNPIAFQALLARQKGALPSSSPAATVKQEPVETPVPQKEKWSGPTANDEVLVISDDDDDVEVVGMGYRYPGRQRTNSSAPSSSPFANLVREYQSPASTPFSSSLPTPTSTPAPTPALSRAGSLDSMHELSSRHTPDVVSKRALSPTDDSGPVRQGSGDKRRRTTDTTKAAARIYITRKAHVAEMNTITHVPDMWPVPRTSVATRIDLSASESGSSSGAAQQPTMDALIRDHSRESWGGSSGAAAGNTDVKPGILGAEAVRCRRVTLRCNGIDRCELTPKDIFKGCERYDPDPDAMRAVHEEMNNQNAKEVSLPARMLVRFYEQVMASKCKKAGCGGGPTIKPFSKGPSTYGKCLFVGCSKWRPDEKSRWDHLFMAIPPAVDEQEFVFMYNNEGKLPPGLTTDAERCAYVAHPRSGMQHCPMSHTKDGRSYTAPMVPHPCDSTMTIYVPLDRNIRKAIVIVKGAHNHPMHSKRKSTTDDRTKLSQAAHAIGVHNVTVSKLMSAPSTRMIFGGDIAQTTIVYGDRRRLRDNLREIKMTEFPRGTGWDGVLHEHQQEAARAPEKRYIQTVTTKGDIKIIVTMLPSLAKRFHSALWLAIDFTFKRVLGDMNEWEIVTFDPLVNQRT
ncbi:hypothetical protein PsYK624_173180 [Phanerochaete sordida]|uniref:Uncharacterized protein n=1 Tax=Phanerochaete sordida TaxID=48140 RepID=A0A9P3GSD0_9APHY|nr:hypothetical protein PsYK624_173180 [Phanerochaete sordida]